MPIVTGKPFISSIPLGQSGFRLNTAETTLYIDPYLSDSVEKMEGSHLKRQVPIKIRPVDIHDADWVLITHIHLDHCDLETLAPIYTASPKCRFIGPKEVCEYLVVNGFSPERVTIAPVTWLSLGSNLRIHATPAAHPAIQVDREGYWVCTGYIIEYGGRKIYHAGDSFVVKPLTDFLEQFLPIDTAMLPVNEHNYFREKEGIVGNMGIRDAFGLAELLQVKKMIPMHWDMFVPNAVFREEIELLHKLSRPSFELVFNPTEL